MARFTEKRVVREFKMLPCKLTVDEVDDRRRTATAKVEQYNEVEAEKKEAVKDYTDRMKSLRSEINQNAREANTATTMRDVECDVVYDYDLKMVRIVRTDTGEVWQTRPMNRDEAQTRMEV
jgi:phosphopantetheine adenylyltransferase